MKFKDTLKGVVALIFIDFNFKLNSGRYEPKNGQDPASAPGLDRFPFDFSNSVLPACFNLDW